jgi:hypothetical protein
MTDVFFLPAALAVSANAFREPVRAGGPRHIQRATAGWPLPVRFESTRLAGGGR